MSGVPSDLGLMPSILDRLTDPDSAGTAWKHGYTVDEMIDVVRRDLEDLLNTRQSNATLPTAYAQVHRSVVAYGLPDLTSLSPITRQQREDVGRILEDVIERFEPRLREVRASLAEAVDARQPTLRFRVEARLCLEPAPDVAFETTLELTTGHSSVKQAES